MLAPWRPSVNPQLPFRSVKVIVDIATERWYSDIKGCEPTSPRRPVGDIPNSYQ